jgi:hypothetical protein
VHRLLAHFTHAMPTGPTRSPPSTHHQDEHLRSYGEAAIHRLPVGGGVILGRAAAVVPGKDNGYHVRLDGTDWAATVAQRLEGSDTAEGALLTRSDPATVRAGAGRPGRVPRDNRPVGVSSRGECVAQGVSPDLVAEGQAC